MSTTNRRPIFLFQISLLLTCASLTGYVAQQNGELSSSILGGTSLRKGQQSVPLATLNESSGLDGSNSPLAKVQYLNVNGLPVLVQFTYTGPPKILPIATADSYPEGSSINLICTVSGGQRKGLTLSWNINGEDIDEQKLRHYSNHDLNGLENISLDVSGSDISILKIWNATLANAGQYTCTAKNPLGQDSTSVKLSINVELKWTKIPKDTELGLNQELTLECGAQGSPAPMFEWRRLPSSSSSSNDKFTSNGSSQVVARGSSLKISRAQHADSGLYECIVSNGADEDLRRVVQVKVRGK